MGSIQGPPGTGKTKVIVEIVRHLFLKRRQNETLRVLFCSTQHEAVQNAVMKLQGEGILIHLNQSREAAQKSKASGLLQRLAQPVEGVQQKLELKIQTDLNLSRATLVIAIWRASDVESLSENIHARAPVAPSVQSCLASAGMAPPSVKSGLLNGALALAANAGTVNSIAAVKTWKTSGGVRQVVFIGFHSDKVRVFA